MAIESKRDHADEPRLAGASVAATSTAAAEGSKDPNSPVAKMKARLAAQEASPALLDVLEPMSESRTGVGIRAEDGEFYEVSFIWDNNGRGPQNLYLKRVLRVEGPSLDGVLQTENSFCLYAFDTNPLGTIRETRERTLGAFKCQRALANNSALAGRLRVSQHEGLGIIYNASDGRELTFYLTGDHGDKVFIANDSRDIVSSAFNPSTVTPEQFDRAIILAKARTSARKTLEALEAVAG